MGENYRKWFGVGMVTVGLTAAMLAGAGMAAAEDAPGGSGEAPSASSNADEGSDGSSAPGPNQPSASKAGIAKDDAGGSFGNSLDDPGKGPSTKPQVGRPGSTAEATEPSERAEANEFTKSSEPAEQAEPTELAEPTGSSDMSAGFSGGDAVAPRLAAVRVETPATAAPDPESVVEIEKSEISIERVEPARVLVVTDIAGADAMADTLLPVTEKAFASTPVLASAAVAPPAVASPFSSLITAVSTLVFNLYTLAARVLSGPPQLPSGSTVSVRSTSLSIDCGDGYSVPADWYFPAGADVVPPQRLIYLQHGFLGSGAWYSYTAATLAERTNSVVVVTSLSSNPMSCDGCALNGDPMRQAIANLFLDDNSALADSARRVGYTEALPQRVVLVGHSAGGGLAVETAGYMIDNGTVGKLAGVLMLDGVPSGDEIPDTLGRFSELSLDIPVYNIAAEPYSWNRDGFANGQLVAARPGEFVGVQVVGGLHSDSVQGGNPLIQLGVYLFTGFSTAVNVEAVQTLAADWVNDMFTGAPNEGVPGETITIPTSKGPASAVVLPAPSDAPSAAAREELVAP